MHITHILCRYITL